MSPHQENNAATLSDDPAVPPRSILVVDDDLALLDALERAFKEAGQRQVTALGNFEDAKRALRAQHFDVLVTDVRLGAFNGLQLAVLAKDLHPGIQLIVFSGFDDPVLRQDAEALGAAYLLKPVTSRELLSRIGERREDESGG